MQTQPKGWSYYCGVHAWGLPVGGSVASRTFRIPPPTVLPINKTVVLMTMTVFTNKANKQQQTKKPCGSENLVATSLYSFAELTPVIL